MVSSLLQPLVLPARHGDRTLFGCSKKTYVVSRVTVSNLQPHSSLRFSQNHVPQASFLGTNPFLWGQVIGSACKPTRRVLVNALDIERFNKKAVKVIMTAQEESRLMGHNFVGTEHLLLGLIGEVTSLAAKMLKSMGINLKDARVEVENIIGRGSGFVADQIPFTPRTKTVLELTLYEAHQLGHVYLGPEHLLLGLLAHGEGVAARVLASFGVDLIEMHKILTKMLREPGEIIDALEASVKNGSTMPKDERDETGLHAQLLEMSENSRLVAIQLEVQNKNSQLDRVQKKEQTDNLLGVLNKIADSLGRIADKS